MRAKQGYKWSKKRPWHGGFPEQVPLEPGDPKPKRKVTSKRSKTKKSSVKLAKKYFKGGMV